MKSIVKYLGIIPLAAFLLFVSCNKKNEDDTPPEKTTSEKLTAGFWKTTALTIDPGVTIGTTVITNYYAQLPSCTQDDLMRFDSDGKITDDEGATKCDANDPQTTNDGTWVLSADGQSISISYPGDDPVTFTINSLNESTLSGYFLLIQDFGSGPLSYTFTQTFTLQ